MTSYRLKTTHKLSTFQLSTSDRNYCNTNNTPNPSHFKKTRKQSEVGSDSYTRSLRRAFARAKLLAFFNPDLTQFITLTYKQNLLDPSQVIRDISYLIKQHNRTFKNSALVAPLGCPDLSSPPRGTKSRHQRINREPQKNYEIQNNQKQTTTETLVTLPSRSIRLRGGYKEEKALKYVYVIEAQKRGALHVHMIASEGLELRSNRNGYNSIKNWSHGFSSVLTIQNFDNDFKPYLYLFKYMAKAQRIGGSFIHTSKSFDEIKNVDYADFIDTLWERELVYTENHHYTLNETQRTIIKKYYRETQEKALS